ncbi:MAG TPA: helix-turn-helix transcriptional regulator [Gammaproteobacteria bacterium]|nr:helix-turn-helix transcriptional regulator [Gammaproteobacteria bacterium]
MTPEEKQFFKTLGARIAAARKMQGLSQQQVADELGVAQQTFAHYEVGYARMPVSVLPKLARLLAVSLGTLLGIPDATTRKRGMPPRFQGLLDRLSRLPDGRRKFILQMIEAAITSAEDAMAKKKSKRNT